MGWSKMVSLELDDEDKLDFTSPLPVDRPDFPYGLRICFCQQELDKLGLPKPDYGDYIDMRAFGRVTSISDDGTGCRVEIQLEQIAVENESTETPGDN